MMRTVKTVATVDTNGVVTAKVPADVPPGTHRMVLLVGEPQAPVIRREPLRFAAYDVGLVSDELTFRREDLYDDDGR